MQFALRYFKVMKNVRQAALYRTNCHFGGVILPWLVFIRMQTYNPLFTKTENMFLHICISLTVHHVMILGK
jgi:hypothetical protein